MKNKAVTFSFDDGIEQDKRLIKILDRYGLKCTFNLNSGRFGNRGHYRRTAFGVTAEVEANVIPADEIKQVYENHEVASHTFSHPTLYQLSDEEVIREVKQDVEILEELTGRPVHGLAYPGGYGPPDPVILKKLTGYDYVPTPADKEFEKNPHRVSGLIGANTDIYYARTTKSTYSFDLQKNLLEYRPTVCFREEEKRMQLAKAFLESETERPQIYYIWGHTYELDVSEKAWFDFEELCEYLAGKSNVFYGTNDEVFSEFLK